MKRAVYTTLDGLGDQVVVHVNDLAEIFQINRVKISEMLATGKIPGMFRIGRCIRIQAGDVRAWIDSEKIPQNKFVHEIREQVRDRVRGSARSPKAQA